MFDLLTETIAWLAFPFMALVIGLAAMTFLYYLRHQHKYFLHIALMALSYTIFSVLLTLTINYRIFFEGWPRFFGALAMLVGGISGVAGLLLIYKRRSRDLMHRTEA